MNASHIVVGGARDSGSAAAETAAPVRWLGLDAVRGVAALSVALFHFSRVTDQLPALLEGTLELGWLGVTAFFVVSGVVIATVLGGQPSTAARFMSRRMLRLAPPYLAAAALALLLNYLSSLAPGYRSVDWTPPTVTQFACNVSYTCDVVAEPWFLVVSWSLAIEVQFYLLACAIAWAARSRFPLASWLIAAGVTLTAFVGDKRWVWSYAPQFALGALVWVHLRGLASAWVCVAMATVALVIAAQSQPPETLAVMATTAAVIVATRRWQPPSWLAQLGLVSYSVYLIHVPIGGRVMNLAMRYAHTPSAQVLAVLAAAAVTLAAASGFYRWVERPSVSLSHGVAYRRHAGDAP